MRLDKFLKVSRIIKRRTVAKDVADAGRITLNGRPAKAAAEVKVGDKISIGFGAKQMEFEVLLIAENARADAAKEMYKVLGGNTESLD